MVFLPDREWFSLREVFLGVISHKPSKIKGFGTSHPWGSKELRSFFLPQPAKFEKPYKIRVFSLLPQLFHLSMNVGGINNHKSGRNAPVIRIK